MKIIGSLALRSLKKNRTSTVVTLVGIVLSFSLMFSVLLFANSFIRFFGDTMKAQYGKAELVIDYIDKASADSLKMPEQVIDYSRVAWLGSAKFAENNHYYHYFNVVGMTVGDETFPLLLKEGRLPEKPGEAVITESMSAGQYGDMQIGDEITSPLFSLQDKAGRTHFGVDDSDMTYVELGSVDFTVVGVLENNPLAFYASRPGCFVYMTKAEIAKSPWQQLRLVTGPIDQAGIDAIADELDAGSGRPLSVNHNLLQSYPGFPSGPKLLIYAFATVLLIIVGLAGIGLIQNAFLISFTKRARELSLLSSIGMTTRQRTTLSLYEGLLLFVLALPLGFGLAVLAMSILMVVLNPILQRTMNTGVEISLLIDWQSLVLIAVSGLIMIFVASILPVFKSRHLSPVAGIRKQTDIRIPAKNLSAPGWLRRIGGMESEVAWKNMKRNKRPFRATLVALVFSLVLYLSLASIIAYAESASGFASTGLQPDILLASADETLIGKEKEIFALLDTASGIEKRQIVYSASINQADSDGVLTHQAKELFLSEDTFISKLTSFDDVTMQQVMTEIGRTEPLKKGEVILINSAARYDETIQAVKIYEKAPTVLNNVFTYDEAKRTDLSVVEVIDRPLKTYNVWMAPFVIASKETLAEADQLYTSVNLYAKDADYQSLIFELRSEVRERQFDFEVNDTGRFDRQTRDTMLLARIILFGFATVIALIGLSNLYNSLIASLQYRKGEFAMLRAVGMSDKATNKMIRIESLFYGMKLILFGIPIAVLVSFLIHRYLNQNINIPFTVPVLHYAIASVAVLIIVYLMMWSGSTRARQGVIADELKHQMEA